jgi:hypothetical protein
MPEERTIKLPAPPEGRAAHLAKKDPRTARGYRNRNPGNIRKTGNWRAWQGIAPDSAQTDSDFIVFRTHAFGIRALVRTLFTYRDRYGLRDVASIIGRWAPPNENNTTAYAMNVARMMGVSTKTPIDVAKWDDALGLVSAIISHELGGNPYTKEQLEEGLRLAGVQRPVPPVTQDPRLRTGAVAGTAIGAVAITEAIQVGREVREAGKAHESAALTIGGSLIGLLAIGALAIGVLKKRRAKQE